jgi:hypothetical protein
MKKMMLAVLAAVICTSSAWAEDDSPTSPEKKPIPGTDGSMWYSGAPDAPPKMPPNIGGSVGGNFPPQPTTRVHCSRNGKPIPCS